jgi:hypothetical protein
VVGPDNPSLLQGDILDNCPVVVPELAGIELTAETKEVPSQIRFIDAIVVTQSCDLEQRKVESVLLCPTLPVEKLQENETYKKSTIKQGLRDGLLVGYHLMNKCVIPGFERDLFAVDFRYVYVMPFDYMTEYVARHGERLRLLPPYVEHLSQGFARHFMRVGLPVGVDLK